MKTDMFKWGFFREESANPISQECMEGLKIMMSLNLLIRLPFMKSQCIVVLENVSSHENEIEINYISIIFK